MIAFRGTYPLSDPYIIYRIKSLSLLNMNLMDTNKFSLLIKEYPIEAMIAKIKT